MCPTVIFILQDGKSATDVAVFVKDASLKDQLIALGVFGSTPDITKDGVFLAAASRCDVAVMKVLKDKWSCDPNTSRDGRNAMDVVIANKAACLDSIQAPAIQLLKEWGIFGNTEDGSRIGLFLRAAAEGDESWMVKTKELVGFDPSTAMPKKGTAMDVAVCAGQWEIVTLLMEWKVYRVLQYTTLTVGTKEMEATDGVSPGNIIEWLKHSELDTDITSQYLYSLVFALDVKANLTDVLSLKRPGELELRRIWNKVLGDFTGVVNGPEDICWVVVFKASKLYLKNDIDLADSQTEHLTEVCEELLLGNEGSMYIDVLSDVMNDPNFSVYCEYLTSAEKLVCKKFDQTKPKQISENLEIVYRNSKAQKKRFEAFVENLCSSTNNKAMNTKGLKFPYRSMQKMANSVVAQWNAESCKDIVRGAAVMSAMSSGKLLLTTLLKADRSLKELSASGGGASGDQIVIVWIKNRWEHPTAAGWADALINFYFADDETKTICELQLIHANMWSVRAHLGAHNGYDRLRVVQELLRITGNSDILKEIEGRTEKTEIPRVRSASNLGVNVNGTKIDALSTSMNALKANNKVLGFTITEMRADNERLAGELKENKEKTEALSTALSDLEVENLAMNRRLTNLEGKFEELVSKVSSSTATASMNLVQVVPAAIEEDDQDGTLPPKISSSVPGDYYRDSLYNDDNHAFFAAADHDGDGKVSLAEAKTYGMDVATFLEIDANKDRYLIQAEYAQWQERDQHGPPTDGHNSDSGGDGGGDDGDDGDDGGIDVGGGVGSGSGSGGGDGGDDVDGGVDVSVGGGGGINGANITVSMSAEPGNAPQEKSSGSAKKANKPPSNSPLPASVGVGDSLLATEAEYAAEASHTIHSEVGDEWNPDASYGPAIASSPVSTALLDQSENQNYTNGTATPHSDDGVPISSFAIVSGSNASDEGDTDDDDSGPVVPLTSDAADWAPEYFLATATRLDDDMSTHSTAIEQSRAIADNEMEDSMSAMGIVGGGNSNNGSDDRDVTEAAASAASAVPSHGAALSTEVLTIAEPDVYTGMKRLALIAKCRAHGIADDLSAADRKDEDLLRAKLRAAFPEAIVVESWE